MAIETQVIPVVTGASEVINKTTFLAVFGSNLCTATPVPSTLDRGKDQVFFSIIFDYVLRIETSPIYSIFLFSFLADGDVLLDEVAFSRLD